MNDNKGARLMRMGRGGVYFTAIMAFAAGLMMVAGPVRAQNQDPPAKLYLTPGAESTAHPLFLQRLFGANGSNSGLGQGKPYDFSTRRRITQETQNWREVAEQFNAENSNKFDAVIEERKKAIADGYAQTEVLRRQDEQRRRQAEAQVQARMDEIARRSQPPRVVYTGFQHHTSRDAKRPRTVYTNRPSAAPPVFYNGQQQQPNAHPPIFLH